MASRFNDDGVTALYQALHAAPGRARPASSATAALPPVDDPPQHAPDADRARRARALPGRDRRHRARLQAARARAQARLARELQQLRETARACCSRGQARQGQRAVEAVADLAAAARGAARRRRAASCSRCGRDMQKAYAGDEYVVKIRDKEIRTALIHTTLSGSKIRKVALPQLRGPRRDPEVADARQRAGQLPVHRRHLRVQARGRGPDAHVRRRRRRLPHQPPLQAAVSAGHAGQAPVDRVRLGHAVRQRPGPAARHLRQGRQLGRLDRDARRHEGAVRRLRPVAARRPRSA